MGKKMLDGWISFEQIEKDDRGKLKFLIPELNKAGHRDNSELWCECIINFDPEGRPPDREYNEYLESQHWRDVRKAALREYKVIPCSVADTAKIIDQICHNSR